MLEDLKRRVVEIARRAEKDGFCKCKSGNFSIKHKETGYILITPSAVSRELLEEKDIIVLNSKGQIIENLSKYKPSSETLMHIKAYETREDVYGVCHTHAPFSTAFAVQNKEIEPVVLEALEYGIRVPVAKYARTGTKELADSIVEPLKISDACLLEKHGALTVGKNIEKAFLNMQYIEEVAKINIYATILSRGSEIQKFPKSEFEAIMKQKS